MKMLHAGMLVLAAFVLVGCGTTSTLSNPPTSTGAQSSEANPVQSDKAPQAIATANEPADAAGLGQIVYSGRDVIDCGRTRRTGSRIPRDVCRPNSFNGLFPSGGINMGTAREGQPSYGNR